jgi:hypothetical protein
VSLPGIATALQAAAGSDFSVDPMGRMGEPASGIVDYMIVGAALVAVLVTMVLMVRGLVHPGERAPHHIKRVILDGATPRPDLEQPRP